MMQAYSLNRELILTRLGDDEEIFAVMVAMYMEDIDGYCVALGNALNAADCPLLQREAHTVKGLLATFADEEGAKAAYAIELQCKQGNLDGLAGPVADVQARLQEVAVVLRKETA